MYYYIRPGLGWHPPFTLYGYKDGDTTVAPVIANFTTSDEGAIPGVTGLIAYKWKLPIPSTFCNGGFAFRFTDGCGITTPLATAYTGTFNVSLTDTNCAGKDLVVYDFNGFTYPISVSIANTANNVNDTNTITDTNINSTIFIAPPPSSNINYIVTVTDACGRSCSKQVNIGPLLHTIFLNSIACDNNVLDSTAMALISTNGMVAPLKAIMLSGPSSYHSSLSNIDININYPDTISILDNGDINFYIHNLPVGDYSVAVLDKCGFSDTLDFSVAPSDVGRYTFAPPTVGGCSGSRYVVSNSNASCTWALLVNLVRVSDGVSIAQNWCGSGCTFNNIAPGNYYVYASGRLAPIQGFSISYNTFLLNPHPSPWVPNDTLQAVIFKDSIVVANLPSSPIIAGLAQAKCGNQVNVRVIPDSTSGAIPFAFEITNGPAGYTAPPQSSPEFDGLTSGTYTFRISDSCGNSGIQNLSVNDMPTAAVQSTNPCVGEDETLSYNNFMPYYNYYWLLPDSSISTEPTLNFNPVAESDTGTYTLVIKSTIGACADSSTASVTIMDCSVLPINLLYFNANKEGQQVRLDWATAMESNNKGFGIEHSADSKKWMALDFINSKATNGNSNTKLEYYFTDAKPFAGVNYYRLKQTDFDGKYQYSVVRQISITDNVNPEIHPNPAKDYVIISNLTGNETISLIDINGKLIKEVKTNNTALTLSLDGLSNGSYQIQVVQKNGSISNHKIVVAK